jgi:hypothetical protein
MFGPDLDSLKSGNFVIPSEGITPDTPLFFLRREAPENILVRKSLIKNFAPDTPFFSRKNRTRGGVSGVIPSDRGFKILHKNFPPPKISNFFERSEGRSPDGARNSIAKKTKMIKKNSTATSIALIFSGGIGGSSPQSLPNDFFRRRRKNFGFFFGGGGQKNLS